MAAKKSRKKVAKKTAAKVAAGKAPARNKKRSAGKKSAPRAAKKTQAAEKSSGEKAKGFVILLDQPNDAAKPGNTIELSADCTISQIATMHRQLLRILGNEETITIEAGAVREIDTAALQLLSAFASDAAGNEVTVTWKDPSRPFSDAVACLGLTSQIVLG